MNPNWDQKLPERNSSSQHRIATGNKEFTALSFRAKFIPRTENEMHGRMWREWIRAKEWGSDARKPHILEPWTAGIVDNLFSAYESNLSDKRSEVAAYLSLAWNFAKSMSAEREKVFASTTQKFRERLDGAFKRMLVRERIDCSIGQWPDSIAMIEERVARASHWFSTDRQRNQILSPI